MIVATHYNNTSNFATILTDNGNKLIMHTFADTPYASDLNAMVVTTKGDIYIAAEWVDKVAKFSRDFDKLVEVNAPYITQLAIDPDGCIWTSEISDETNNAIFKKRDPLTLEILDTCDGLSVASMYGGMIFDSDGFLYVIDWYSEEIEKWNVVTKTRVAHRALANHTEDNPAVAELRIKGDTVYLMEWASYEYGDYWTCPTDLSEDFEAHELSEWDWVGPSPGDGYWVQCMIPFGTDGWIVMGVIAADVHVMRYDNDFTLVWDYQIDAVGDQDHAFALELGYYVTAYDYPLAPVMFPASVLPKELRDELRLKCVNFEESMSDVCLTLNYNIKIIRSYLQTVYGGEGFDESNNLRDVLPSQQLVKLSRKDLALEDYNRIVNNFILNIADVFLLVNQNNTLIKTWLDDYEPDEEGHEFTNVKMTPIVVNKNKLTRTMDDLFTCMKHNVAIINNNSDTLIERF